MPTYHKDLRTKRKRLGITQAELSEHTGIACPNICMYESGRKPLTESRYMLLDAALDKIIVLKINQLRKLARNK